MPGKAVGRAAVDLPWLCPNTDSLVGLAERPADLPRLAAADPALLIFLARFATPPGHSPVAPPSERLFSASLPDTAAAYLAATVQGWLDPAAKVVAALDRTTQLAARIARQLAEQTRRVTADIAEAAARLAPLGWYAVAAVDPSDAAACLRDPLFAADPARCQHAWWGLDHDAIARRLAGRWRFPDGLVAVAGNLNQPLGAMAAADADLVALAGLAWCEAQSRTTNFGLTRPADRSRFLTCLGIDDVPVADEPATVPRSSGLDPNPHRVALVGNVLKQAADARRRNGASLVVRLEDRIDGLTRQVAEMADTVAVRVRDAKLAGLAELAAGAGHEINNPLAVISGNAQRLLRTEADPDRGETLRSVVRQTQRIAGILHDLMRFARPGKPEKRPFAASEVLLAVRTDLEALATERDVRLELAAVSTDVWLDADAKQLRQVLTGVVRNGIEAAPKDGWVRLGCEADETAARFVIEDSGPGLTAEAVEHAFDPFFCGRSAGRGRGLGLPTAWRLAKLNGGDVRLEPNPGGPTRFVVTVPCADADGVWAGRKSA